MLYSLMTNQKFLGILLIVFIIGAVSYLGFSKFKQGIKEATSLPSPSPSPQSLDFTFNKSPVPDSAASNPGQVAELPLSKNKKLPNFPGILKPEVLQNKKAIIQTPKGLIQLQIYPEASSAASNFMILAANGFYDGLTFHRVEDWVVQGGDPFGNGAGTPGYTEIEKNLFGKYDKGIVAYAKRADEPPGSFGSQFFIMKKDTPLPLEYAIFGKVISGMDVVEKLVVGDKMQRVVIQNLQ